MTNVQNVQVMPQNVVKIDDKKKKSTVAHAGAGLVAYMAAAPLAQAIKVPTHKLAMRALDSWGQSNHMYKEAMLKAYANSGLAGKVELVSAQNLNPAQLEELAKGALPKWGNKLPKKIQDSLLKYTSKALSTIKDGKNAAFIPASNKILINTDKMAGASFHEMGHAMNKHFKGLGNVLQKMRHLGKLTPLILLIAAFKPKKAEGEQPKNIVDKTTTFVKNNAGKLAFASMVPILLEEAMASIKGAKLAKPHLNADAFRKLNIGNAKAWLTYFAGAVAMGLMAKVSSEIHDKIMEKRDAQKAKNAEKA